MKTLTYLISIALVASLGFNADIEDSDIRDQYSSSDLEVDPDTLSFNTKVNCIPELPTLEVAKENKIRSYAEYTKMVKENHFFILGVSDSTCETCCDSEPLLLDIFMKARNKAVISYPDNLSKNIKV